VSDGQTLPEWDERAFIAHFEAAGTDELARILSLPSRREEEAQVAYLGADSYARMHERALRRNLRRATEEPKANVVVLHGIMGAELTATDRTGANSAVWVRPLRLLAGAIRRLQLDAKGLQEADLDWTVRPSAILKKHYGELILSLSTDLRVLPFFYDWRKDVKHAGDALNAAITSSFSGDMPVHLVAHSMGGLVARSFIADYEDRWNAMRGRLVMLGTPNHGSYDIVRALAGRERLIRLLALADFRMSLDELLGILNSFPGTYQLLPSPAADKAAAPLYERATYGAVNVSQAHLESARANHERLAAAKVDPERMLYVAGAGQATFVGVDPGRITDDDGYAVSRDGDGRVSHALGLLEGVRTWYAPVSHGDLTRDRAVLQAVGDLLENGMTDVLEDERPATRGAEDEPTLRKELLARDAQDVTALRAVLRQLRVREGATRSVRGSAATDGPLLAEPPGRVTEQERVLEDLIVRGWLSEPETRDARAVPRRPPPPTIHVGLHHGDIAQAHDAPGPPPVDVIAVGHYIGVKPQYAEAALDEAISEPLPKPSVATPEEGWILTQLTLRGTITGGLGQPFLLPDPRSADGLIAIVGIGLPGRLGSGELSVAVRELCWAVGRLGRAHLATVLIGSGAGNLVEEEAVEAWANGIAQALGGQDEAAPRLSRVTIVEFHAERVKEIDRALVRVAERMARDGELELVYEPGPKPARSAAPSRRRRARARADDEREPIPTRMTISREPRGYRFGAITETASVPERVIALDGTLVNQANDELAGEPDDHLRRERGRFLGKLLIPRDLRDQLGGKGPVVMILDSTTARIHWELVTRAGAEPTAPAGDSRPGDLKDYLGVGLGITRQLRTTFAPPPEPPPPPERLLRVLVVADPAEDAHLPGAEEEGSEVGDLFERVNAPGHPVSVEVVRLFGPRQASRTEVLRLLLLERFHILHFAGHCFYDADDPSASGWIFSDGATLSANELDRIDRVPEFVFSNACESGITPDRSGERSAALAPSFAESFFARGVRNFVCTAWPVDDAAARTFAIALYSGLLGLDGNPPLPIYRAMQKARQVIADMSGGARSWGAYQHYGDPLYRLVAAAPRRDGGPGPRRAEPRGPSSQ
jgi:hypothetical protein